MTSGAIKMPECVCVCECVGGGRGHLAVSAPDTKVYLTVVNGGNWAIRCRDTLPAVPGNDVLQLRASLSLAGGNCNEL